MLEEQYGMKLPGGRLKKEPQTMLMTLSDITNVSYMLDRFEPKICKQCKSEYTLQHKYLVNAGGAREFCGAECASKFIDEEAISYNVNYDFVGVHNPVIYKITHKDSGRCYIGKTTQAFTLRWYQHFYQGGSTRFHAAIKAHGVDKWIFEIIEILTCEKHKAKDLLIERENYWIKHYNSIVNGYNSVRARDEPEPISLPFDISE